MKKYGNPHKIVTDRLASYRAALKDLSMVLKQEVGRYKNNRAENSHLVFRRRDRAMKYFKKEETLQRFTSIQGSIYNHFNHERHYYKREEFKQKREAALTEWRELSIA